MKISVYIIENTVNTKKYIGITSKKIEVRFAGHIYQAQTARMTKFALHRAMIKHGVEHFNIRVLYEVDDWASARALEISSIKEYDTFVPNGYNLTLGGEGTLGRKYSLATRERLSAARKKRKTKDETRKKLSLAFKKKPIEFQKKFIYAFKGKKQSHSARKKIAESKHKPVQAIDKQGNVFVFPSIKEASIALNIHYPNISGCCLGTRKSAGGYTWSYLEVYGT